MQVAIFDFVYNVHPLDLLLFFYCCSKDFKYYIKEIGENRQFCLALDFSVTALSSFSFKLMFVIFFLYIAFIMFRYETCIWDLSKSFNMKECWILSKARSTSNEIMCYFSFCLLICWIMFMAFHILNCGVVSCAHTAWSLVEHRP